MMSDEQITALLNQFGEMKRFDMIKSFIDAKDKDKWLKDNAQELENYSAYTDAYNNIEEFIGDRSTRLAKFYDNQKGNKPTAARMQSFLNKNPDISADDVNAWFDKTNAYKAAYEEERKYKAERVKRAKEVENLPWYKDIFTSDYSKQRYIDDPTTSILGGSQFNPYSKEGQSEIRDQILGATAGATEFLPGIGGVLIGPTIRAGRDAYHKYSDEKYKPEGSLLTNYATDVGMNAGVEYLPTAILSRISRGTGRAAKGARFLNDPLWVNTLNKEESIIKEGHNTIDDLLNSKVYDNNEIYNIIRNLPDSEYKADLLSNIDLQKGNLRDQIIPIHRKWRTELSPDVQEAWRNVREKGYDVTADKNSKYFLNKVYEPKLSRIQNVIKNTAKYGENVGPGIVKSTTNPQVNVSDKDRTQKDWLTANYIRQWEAGFKPKEMEGDPLWEAYKEWKESQGE